MSDESFLSDQDAVVTARISPFSHLPDEARRYIKDLLAEMEGLRRDLFSVFKESCESNTDLLNSQLAGLLLRAKVTTCPACNELPLIRVAEVLSDSYLDQIVLSHSCARLNVNGPIFDYLSAVDDCSHQVGDLTQPTPSSRALLEKAKEALLVQDSATALSFIETVLMFGLDDYETVP